jgi:uncharacterized protein YegL
MPYNTVATGKTPALIIYLLDISGSMNDSLDGIPKIDHVNQAIERLLVRMVQRSAKGEVISPRYRLSMIAYSDSPIDILGGIRTIDEIVQLGKPTLSATNSTNTAAAFDLARDILRGEIAQMDRSTVCPAPMICHLTDGQFTGADPEPIARDIMQMETPDGPVLVENIYVGPDLTAHPIYQVESWRGVMDVNELNDQYARKLFNISSPLPASYAEVINEMGYELQRGAKMLIPCSNKDLIELAFAMSGATPTGR